MADDQHGEGSGPVYPVVDPQPNFSAIEERVLARWANDATFGRSVASRSDAHDYVFYDGPPFANGLPHHGHLLTGYVKDVIPRYKTMRGYRVERRFGWDCHGLPAEMETERELDVAGRAAITEYGIDRFNEACRSSVLRYVSEWETTVTRQARWVDFDNDYKTMDLPYMESVIWAFKQLHDKGLIYQAFRVMPYSWGAQTPLSNFEIRLDDATRPRQDPALTVWFEAALYDGTPEALAGLNELRLLAWTTTPWTLPSNLALAVGDDIDYCVVVATGSPGPAVGYVLGAETLGNYEADLVRVLGDHTVVATVKGRDLVGLSYEPMFSYFADRTDAFKVLSADFIDTAEGTGIVHMAPAFGEDDQVTCEANGISIGDVVPVDERGCFTEPVSDFANVNVFDANPTIIAALKERGVVLRHATYEHNYPHCWRTDTPIIYKAISSWYVDVTAIRDRLGELNQQINWVPTHVRDGRFGQWLAGARDWSISRNRFWGTPIPVWVSDDPNYPRTDVYGSLKELEADFGTQVADLHRPFIDELTRPNPDDPSGRSTMRRTEGVLDCWFESGSMPFAQVHYPFENKDWFEANFPADFIVEYINQTRGWFYTLHVLAGALFDRPAFSNVICHGILLAGDGEKLSKRLRNYTEPTEIFERFGSDALRWYLMSTHIVRGGDTRLSDDGIAQVTRQVLIPIWNAYSFFTLYANADGYRAEPVDLTAATSEGHDPLALLDRYMLAKTASTLEAVTAHLDAYDLPGAAAELAAFIDALNNWYIRRSRDRFWGTDDVSVGSPNTGDDVSLGSPTSGDADAFDTLYCVLVTFTQMAAPLLPMIAEEIYTGLTGEASVHLTDWPDPQRLSPDGAHELVASMDTVRDVASAALRLREDAHLRVRLPLARLTVAGEGASALAPLTSLLTDEVNVRAVELTDTLGSEVEMVLKPSGAALGPRLGADAQRVFAAARSGDWHQRSDGTVVVGDIELTEDEFELDVSAQGDAAAVALSQHGLIVTLDTALTPELEAEGLARDLIRQVQQARKDAGLAVTDRISLTVRWTPEHAELARAHAPMVTSAVLATSLEWLDGPGDEPQIELTRAS